MYAEKLIAQYFSKILDDYDLISNKIKPQLIKKQYQDNHWILDNKNNKHLKFFIYNDQKISNQACEKLFNTRIFLQKLAKLRNKKIHSAYFSLLKSSGVISLNKFKHQQIIKNEKLEIDKNCSILGLIVKNPSKTCLILNGNKNFIRQMKLISFDDKRQFGEFNLSNDDRLVLYIRLY